MVPIALLPLLVATTSVPIDEVRIVSRVADEGVADDRPKRARADEGVTMYVAVRAGKRWYSDAGTIAIGARSIDATAIAAAPPFEIAWFRVEPAAADLSNTATGRFRYETIEYRATPLAEGALRLDADVRPTLTPDYGDGVGTMRYQVVVTQGAREVASPGAEARRGRAAGGLRDDVHRISLRRDDTYLGYLTELYGQPYIWASAGATDPTHQSERLEGGDCADFVVYGARRLGKDLPYTWTGSLPDHARTLARGAPGADGVYVDRDGAPLPFPRAGDLILFPRHVGALVADRGTVGVLDTADVMMHAYFDTPKEQPIADSGYGDQPIRVLRFR